LGFWAGEGAVMSFVNLFNIKRRPAFAGPLVSQP
jgi:hypothetical protein